MRWSYQVFKVYGIPIQLHLTFIVWFMMILGVFGIQGFLFFTLLFTIVLAHELVHSLTAILYNVNVAKITLLPIGGLASIELPDDPMLELKVSVVGPLFNFMLAGVGFVLLTAFGLEYIGYGPVMDGVMTGSFAMDSASGILSVIVSINLILGAFNMLPAFPMDGGRVFRGTLALWIDYVAATRVATLIGQLIFLTIAFFGLLSFNLLWIVIGVFLFYAGGSEMRYVNLRRLLGGLRLRDIAIPGLTYVNESLTWRQFMGTVYRRGRSLYLVVDSLGALKGVLDLTQLSSVDLEGTVGESASLEYTVLEGRTSVQDALKTLLVKNLVLVEDGGKLAGYVTPDTLSNTALYYGIGKRLNRP